MTAFPHATADQPLPPNLIMLAAQVRAFEQARDAIAGDVPSTYGRIDGLLQQRRDELAAAYRLFLAAAAPLTPAQQALEAEGRG